MSRLDQHIVAVRNKLALGVFIEAWAWLALMFAVLVELAILCQRLLDRTLPHQAMLLWIGLVATVMAGFIYGIVRRPSAQTAAVAIDQTLGLKEKFSTALFVRASNDPFAKAAVRDAEATAQQVSLYNRFPLRLPPRLWGVVVIAGIAFLTALFFPTFHMLPKAAASAIKFATTGPSPTQEQFAKQELPKIEEAAVLLQKNDAIKRATDDLNRATQTKDGDDNHAKRSLLSALTDYNKAMAAELDKNEQFQTVEDQKNQLAAMPNATDDSSPMGKAQNEMKAGDLDAAMSDMTKAVNDFNKEKPEDQQKTIDQAKQLADALSKAGNDPKAQQQITQKLMQMGATQSQAQQASAMMQRAASGDKQAQQQLQQAAQSMAQQMNGGKGPTQQQQQQIKSMMAQAQAVANAQAQAQALSSSTSQLANAMQQAKAGQQAQIGAPPKPGQQNSPSAQQMAQAQQNMQQQMGQMQAQAKDAQAMKAAADAAAQAAADAAAGLSPAPGSGQGQADAGGGQGQGQGQGGQGQDQAGGQNGQNPNAGGKGQPGQGQGGMGPGGSKMGIAMAPYSVKQEMDASKDIDSGRVLASRYVKAGIDPGKSTASLRDAAPSLEKDSTDSIDQDHISREAQQSVKDYFSAMQREDGQ